MKINTNIIKQVNLHCQAEANPESQIIWFGEGGVLNDECGGEGALANTFGEAALDYDQFYSGNAEDDITNGYVPRSCEIQITRDDSVEGVFVTTSNLTLRELDLESIQSTSFLCIAENDVPDLIGIKQYVKLVLELEGITLIMGIEFVKNSATF